MKTLLLQAIRNFADASAIDAPHRGQRRLTHEERRSSNHTPTL
jgi:hypothetical protein